MVLGANFPDLSLFSGNDCPEIRVTKIDMNFRLDKIRVTPTGQSLSDAVAGLVDRRNTYTHQAKLDYEHHGDDFVIVQALLEFWLLRLLACPDSAIDRLAYRDALMFPE
jgi:hypothetical protein